MEKYNFVFSDKDILELKAFYEELVLDYVVIGSVIIEDEEFSFSGQIYSIPCYM